MKQKYFLDSISDETLAKMIDTTIRFEKAQNSGQSKAHLWRIIPAVAAIVLVIGLINFLPFFQPPEDTNNDVGIEITSDDFEITTPEETTAVEEIYPDIDAAPVVILDETIIGDLIISTQKGQEPIQNDDGTITLPNGGWYKLPNGDEVNVWSSITIQSNGKIDKSLPINKGKRITIVRANGDIISVEPNGAVMIKGEYIEDLDIDIILNNVKTPDYEYMLQSDNTIEITRYIGDTNAEEIIIPGEIDGIKVTSIGYEAFLYDESMSIKSITIPDSVVNIARYAFTGCVDLTAVNADINNPVYSSRDGVLFDKSETQLVYFPRSKSESYVIPYGVTHINTNAFTASNLKSVTIPNTVTDIGYYAFAGNWYLKSITLPDNLKYIGVIAFKDCIGLTSLTIPGSVETIDVSAFMCCTGLTDVIIEDGVKNINGGAFSYCTNLTSVKIPDSVTHIGDSADDELGHAAPAFWDCPNLTVYCSEGSYAHGYCLENGIGFALK